MVSPSKRRVTDPLGQGEAVQRPPVGKDKGILTPCRSSSRTRKPTNKAAALIKIPPKRLTVKTPIKAQEDTCLDSRLDENEEQIGEECSAYDWKLGKTWDAETKLIIKHLREAIAGAESKGQGEQERVNSTLIAEPTDAPVLHDESRPRTSGPRLTMIKARARGTISESTDAALSHDESSRPRGPGPRLTTIKARARGTAGPEKVSLKSQVVANMSEMRTCEAGLRSDIPKNDDKSENLRNASEFLSDVPTDVAKEELLGSSVEGMNKKGIEEQSTTVHEDSAEETTLPKCSFNKQEEIAWENQFRL